MLKSLYISNFVLIDELVYEPASGFSVVTGETGAGKSIILGALGLLTGKRADSTMLRPGAKKCVIEAVFSNPGKPVWDLIAQEDIEPDDDACIVRREISSNGKSRAFVNDTPASLSLLKSLGEVLIDIHSQHKNLLLSNTSFQLDVLDTIASDREELNRYRQIFTAYEALKREATELKALREQDIQEHDYLAFQYNQLVEAGLQPDELPGLEEEARELEHAQEIKQELTRFYQAFMDDERGASAALHVASEALKQASKYMTAVKELQERLHACSVELDDIVLETDALNEKINYDPERLALVSDRIDLINSLLMKHKKQTTDELLILQDELSCRLGVIEHYDERIEEIERRIEDCRAQLVLQGEQLYRMRSEAARTVSSHVVKELSKLGIPHIRFEVDMERSEQPGKDGFDSATFLFSANPDIRPEPVSGIASGGEVARLMLTLKALIAKHKSLPTIIFDEIDTGVSGDITERVGVIMREMGAVMQVVAVTHLPQIAAAGKEHFFVYKEVAEGQTRTRIKKLEDEERIQEVARMQSGGNLTPVALAAAGELIKKSR
ncbi:Recombination protein N [Porphyromonas macacae]|uniref:DNA repair protein RecN n=1 Tax=Porphyromonas macacae TaxID=28115 RepID=A0A379E9E5_9PORP|nr:DNA repair protein RecN [Porphyromonas macacae]SUB88944.1 Recombination protein N [Porphyromonas macacae]